MLTSIMVLSVGFTVLGLIGLPHVIRRFQDEYRDWFGPRYTRFVVVGFSVIAATIATAHAFLVVGWVVVGPNWIFDTVFRTGVLGLLYVATLVTVVVLIVVVLGLLQDDPDAAPNVERES